MSQAILALLGAVIGTLAATTGQLLAPIVQSKRAHQHWVRDKRADVLEEYHSALSSAEAEGWLAVAGVRPAVAGGEPLQYRSELAERLFNANAKVDLYASTGVKTLASAATNAFGNLTTTAQDPELNRRSTDLLREAAQQFLETVRPVRRAIRQELGVQT